MVSINYSSREVCCKIVYYGPGLSGKTTNLIYVHSKVPSDTRGKMISLATEADRTLYFDFLPINIGTINGFAAKFQLYTVPGQVYYNATRKLVLRGVDGVVFVADSQPDKMDENIESLSNLEDNLQEYGYDINELPMVIQYNKRDLPGVLSVEELNVRLNTKGRPSFEASATVGNGVFDTLKMIIKMVLEKAKNSANARSKPKVSFAPQQQAQSENSSVSAATSHQQTGTGTPSMSISGNSRSTMTAESSPSAVAVSNRPSNAVQHNTVPADDPQNDNSFRPYPGSENESAVDRKISPTSFTPAHHDEKEDSAINQRILKSESGVSSGEEMESGGTPLMAPSMKKRGEKKRGFFKRLFGIK